MPSRPTNSSDPARKRVWRVGSGCIIGRGRRGTRRPAVHDRACYPPSPARRRSAANAPPYTTACPRYRAGRAIAALALTATAFAATGWRGHAAGQGLPPNVLLARGRTEPAVAIDPRDARRIMAVANPDYYHVRPDNPLNGTFASRDGGAVWLPGAAPTYGQFTGVADPSVGFDGAGRAYYLYMAETPAYCGESGNTALLLARSRDGGRTFGAPTVVDVDRSDDKPYVAVGTGPGEAGVYATFTRWNNPYRQILFTRSLDGGVTFAPPSVLYASSGVNMGSMPVLGPRGRVYVFWAHYDTVSVYAAPAVRIMLRASEDGGAHFGPTTTVAAFPGLPRMLMPGALRLFTFPTVGVDPRSGAIYAAWTRARSLAHPQYAGQTGADLVLVRSRDGGRTWSRPLRLDDAPAGDRFMPALSVGVDGVVRVAFYDRRVDGVRFGLYAVAARDLGGRLEVWPNRRLSATLSSPYTLHYIPPGSTCVAPGRFMGDYIGAATAPGGALAVVWTDTAFGVAQESDVWFASAPPGYLQGGPPRLVRWR